MSSTGKSQTKSIIPVFLYDEVYLTKKMAKTVKSTGSSLKRHYLFAFMAAWQSTKDWKLLHLCPLPLIDDVCFHILSYVCNIIFFCKIMEEWGMHNYFISIAADISFTDPKRTQWETKERHTDSTPNPLLQIYQRAREMVVLLASHLCQQVLIADHTACQNTH